MEKNSVWLLNVRVATAQGQHGIWMFICPDREDPKNWPKIVEMCYFKGNLPRIW